MLTKTKKQKIIKDLAIHKTDTGSSEVQIGLISKRIEELSGHLKQHAKDNHSRKGLLGLVAKRQSHLKYLAKNDSKRFEAISKKIARK